MSQYKTNDHLMSMTIAFLRFPLAVGVVFIHYNLAKNPFTMHGVEYGTNCAEWFKIFATFFSNVLPRIGVPLFFFISGFLFFYGKDFCRTEYLKKIHKRFSTLFVPFILWNTLAILLSLIYMLPFLSSIFPTASQTEIHFSFLRILKTYFANFENEGIFVSPENSPIPEKYPWPINVPLWYVRDLMVLIILTPVIYNAIKYTGKWIIITLGLFYYFIEALFMPEGGWIVMMIRSSFFFSWGAYFSIGKINFIDCMRDFKYAPLLYIPLAITDTLTKTTDFNIFIEQAGIIIGIVSTINITSILLETGKIRVYETLSQGSFFIFSLHTLIISEIGKIIFIVMHLNDNTYSILFLYLIVPIITIIICISLYMILKRYAPFICRLLTGGR